MYSVKRLRIIFVQWLNQKSKYSLMISIPVIFLFVLSSCTIKPISEENAQRSVIAPDAENCLLVDGGEIYGEVLHEGELVRNGTFVSLVFNGGPLQKTMTTAGQYHLPLLARECDGEIAWIDFQLWAGGEGQTVTPTQADYRLDIDWTGWSQTTPSNVSSCSLVLGTVQGAITINGKIPPDETYIVVDQGSNSPNLRQIVVLDNGHYSVTSVGTQCEALPPTFMPIILHINNETVTITPDDKSILANINLPLNKN